MACVEEFSCVISFTEFLNCFKVIFVAVFECKDNLIHGSNKHFSFPHWIKSRLDPEKAY